MRNNKRIAVPVAVACLVAVWAGWGAIHVGAVPPDGGDRIAFGMVGITANQTARLNVAYQTPDVGDKRRSDPEWIVRMQFLDEMGEVLAEQTVRLMPGHAAFLDFPFESRGIVIDNGRQQIRGIVVQQQIRGIVVQQGTLLGTVEVFDNETGRTQFVLPGTTVGGPSPHM